VLTFDAEFAGKTPQDFVLEILVNELRVSHVVIGQDFRFGKGRARDAAVLDYMGEMEGIGVTMFAQATDGREAKLPASEVRSALRGGHPEEAARLLGHWWTLEGHVAPGDKRGRTIGFPTANLRLERVLQPAFGVYAVRARVHGGEKVYDGVANFGLRPMFA